MIKPTRAGLSTNLVGKTDKVRLYYMHLVSSKTEYVAMVTWYDPVSYTHLDVYKSQKHDGLQLQKDTILFGFCWIPLECKWGGWSRWGAFAPFFCIPAHQKI